ncbi:hypothetical protein [Glutamicibacter sp. NPDC087344]|uniref:hypothetical protein n=1 Tax=Glutamicibacter sp. NPDC087344 TaxID=3363994 RepID=UPI0038272938
MSTIRLPRIAVSRDVAKDLVWADSVKADEPVVLDGRWMVVNTDAFASQLTTELRNKNIVHFEVLGGSPEWQESIRAAGLSHDVQIKVQPLD